MSGYTNEQQAIRQSFANYLGALINASAFENDLQKENVIALLCEELTKYVNDGTDTINIKVARPILEATLWILKKYKQDMIMQAKQASLNIENSEPLKELSELINKLDLYILNNIKGKGDE